jgi:hypothetical protein
VHSAPCDRISSIVSNFGDDGFDVPVDTLSDVDAIRALRTYYVYVHAFSLLIPTDLAAAQHQLPVLKRSEAIWSQLCGIAHPICPQMSARSVKRSTTPPACQRTQISARFIRQTSPPFENRKGWGSPVRSVDDEVKITARDVTATIPGKEDHE